MEKKDLLPIIISFSALVVSVMSYINTQKHNEITTQPVLNFHYKFSIGSEDGGHLKVVNTGSGNATITKITGTFDGKPISTDSASFSKEADSHGFTQFATIGLAEGDHIGAGQHVKIFNIPSENYTGVEICQKDKQRKAFFEKLKIAIEYKSDHDVMRVTEFNYRSSNYHKNCDHKRLTSKGTEHRKSAPVL